MAMETKDFVAIYAAIVSTGSIVWQLYTWKRSGPILRVRVAPGMKLYGATVPDNKTYLAFYVDNVGKGTTTITHAGYQVFEGWWGYLRRRPANSYVVPMGPPTSAPLPYVLESGRTYVGLGLQDAELEAFSRDQLLFGVIAHSMGKKVIQVRVEPIKASG